MPTLSCDDTFRAVKILKKIRKIKRSIDPIGGYDLGDDFRQGLEARLVNLDLFILSSLSKADRQAIKDGLI